MADFALNISLGNALALLGALVVLAAIPGLSVLTVTSRSAAFGFRHGVLTTIGILCGDIIFIVIAVLGLVFLVQTFEGFSSIISSIGGLYLLWLGFLTWQSSSRLEPSAEFNDASLFSSFFTGLMITLADQKAILFYLGFFPAFIDLKVLSLADFLIVICLTILGVGGVKLAFAALADRAVVFWGSNILRRINVLAGGLMCAIGLYLIARPFL